jgi:nitrogen fixation/metabolism regulation signal transduction histidine kinase
MIVAERDRAEVYQEWMLFRNLFLTLVAGLVLLVGMIGWLLGRSIVTPLQRLARAAERIAAGKLDVQLPVARGDEVGQLIQVFNQMAGRLRAVTRRSRRPAWHCDSRIGSWRNCPLPIT